MSKELALVEAAKLYEKLKEEALKSVLSAQIVPNNILEVKEVIISYDAIDKSNKCFVFLMINGKPFKEEYQFSDDEVRKSMAETTIEIDYHRTEDHIKKSLLKAVSEKIFESLMQTYYKKEFLK